MVRVPHIRTGCCRGRGLSAVLIHLAILLGCLAAPARAQEENGDIPPPVPLTPSDTAFLNTVQIGFQPLPSNLKGATIHYTLEGSSPTGTNGKTYQSPFQLDHSDTLIAATVRGSRRSPILRVIYRKAVLPRPIARFGGNADFISTRTLVCTLEVAASVKPGAPNEDKPIQILYSLDGARSWTPYKVGQPLAFTRTSVLTAVATHPDYDTSAILTQTFHLVSQVTKPQLVGSTIFTSRYHQVKFTSATPGAKFIYTTHSTNPPDRPDTAVTLEGLYPGQPFTVRVFAAKAGMANSEIASGTYFYQPEVAPPEVNPKQFSFTDTLRITLHSATEDARIFYTLNNQNPTLNSLPYDNARGILLDTSATLRAKAFKVGQTPSGELNVQYILRLSAPYPSVGSRDFPDILNVSLSAANPKAGIEYTLDGGSGVLFSQIQRGQTISLSKDTTRLWAVAVLRGAKGDVKSDTAKYRYTRRLDSRVTPEPVFDPGAHDFTDSVTVRLVAPATTAIYYSRDGGTPIAVPENRYTLPIVLKQTTTLKAIAVQSGMSPSAPVTARYVLIPAPPIADPPADRQFSNRVEVTLRPKSPGSEIRYEVGTGTAPVWSLGKVDQAKIWPPNGKLAFLETTRLSAVTVTGVGADRRISDPILLVYDVAANPVGDSLLPQVPVSLSNGYAIVNLGTAPIPAQIIAFESLGARGFRDASHAVKLEKISPISRVRFVKPTGRPLIGIYSYLGEGRSFWVDGKDSVDIKQAGTYFAAEDTQPPSLVWIPQAARSGDSAVVMLHVTDNVQNVSCTIQGSSLSDQLTPSPAADGTFSFTVRNARDFIRGLWFQATATDGPNITRLPRTGGRHYLPQIWNKVSTPPLTYTIGNPERPWDMVGLPLGASTTLTVAQLKADNNDPSLTVLSRVDGKLETLVDGDALEPGVAYWIAAKHPKPSLVLSNLRTPAPDTDGVFRVRLRPEWNLIANPSLDTLYWPISRAHPRYKQNLIRGLWGYSSNDSLDWVKRDFLEPWQGYWVFSYVEHDTTVALSPTPVLISPGAALKAAAEPEVEIQLDFGRSFPLYLGALPYGQDGVGVEDEPVLPAWGNQREAWTIRDQKRLMTDVVRFRADQAMRWRLALKGPPPGREAPVRVVESRMPPGFEAWAWSPSRNLKVRLERLAAWTVAGPETDTMVVIAGPSAKLASLPELARAVEEIKEFSTGVRMGKGGARLRLALPGEGLVQAELLSLSGRRLATVHSGRLGTGMHDLAVPATGAGIVILRVRVQGTGWSGERIHKLAR